MANPRRSSYSSNAQLPENSPLPSFQAHHQTPSLSSIVFFLKKPHAFPLLLSIFLLLTWVSLRLQHSNRFSFSNHRLHWSREEDAKAGLIRFSAAFPSQIAKDKRGWLLDPIAVAREAGITGGAAFCASIHMGEIRPRGLRGNHRHHTCNETFLIWGAKTKFRLENSEVVDKGYAEVIIGADEVAVAGSPSGMAHALVNVDPIRTAFFLGCQDSIVNNSSSSTDFNVWKDLKA
ncbi:uncharacterized protein LOC131144069 [Malania oleifera]|uniref:uncharacterized protein LOC131144069 n=1 Tax=Malania oleifera TaxID=397392 RepID=UPI0025ADA867|nr:uncharacterized protein LOC131144069 [Malania oleifera]